MSTYRLDRLLSPHSLAIIGASPRESSVGRHVIANIVSAGFSGPVHVVNPHYAEIEGLATVKSLAGIAEAPDLAIIAVPPTAVPEAVAEAGRRGTAAAVIITAGLGHGPRFSRGGDRRRRASHGHAPGRAQLPRRASAVRALERELRGARAAAG